MAVSQLSNQIGVIPSSFPIGKGAGNGAVDYWAGGSNINTEHKEPTIHPLVKIGKQLKSLDGIDEVAQALGQILPGLAGPIATSAVLSVATPFVFLGLLGMKDEYKEACDEFKEILAEKRSTDARLKAMTENADKWRSFLAKKLNLSIAERGSHSTLGKLSLSDKDLDNFASTVVESEVLRNKEFIARLGKVYGWTGIAGMGGMFAGMLPATATAGINIFKEVGITSASATSAAGALSIASGGAFLAGQAAMSAYAANKARQGTILNKMLHSDREQFLKHASGQVKDSTKKSVLQILDKDIRYNKRGNIEYGAATVAGQAAMAAGTITSLTGFLAWLGIPLVAAGAPITVAAALGRIFYNHKEEKFVGDDESGYAKKRLEKLDLSELLLNEKENKPVMGILEEEFEFTRRQLAYTKLYSLMRHLVNDKKYSNYSAQQKFARLEKMVSSGKSSYFQGTSLRGDVLDSVKEIFNAQKETIKEFTRLPKKDANKVLLRNIINCTNISEGNIPPFEIRVDIDGPALKELMELTDMRDKPVYKRFLSRNLLESDSNTLSQCLLNETKNALKSVRHEIAHKFVHVSHVEKLRDIIANENTRQTASPSVSHVSRYMERKNISNTAQLSQVA